ncbi:uncharacterized protein LOC135496942 [Lineus longissimus]|uniref:uncharacterized protein LOC135496942 n=1 Tax=Lineus longissimus TaxID=88925 RepID=UPI00315C96E8
MVRQLGKVNDSVIRSAMTQPMILSHRARNPSMGPNTPTQDFQNNLEFDRRTPKERFFDKVTVVNSKTSFLPQIPNNLTSQSGLQLVGTSSPLQEVFYFGRKDTNAELSVQSPVDGSDSVKGSGSEQSRTRSAASLHSLQHSISRQGSDSILREDQSAASVHTRSLQSNISRQELDAIPSESGSRSLQYNISRQDSDFVVSVCTNNRDTLDVQGTSPAEDAVHGKTAEDISKAAPCLTNSQKKNLTKRRKSGKKKHKSTTGRQSLRSTSRKSKHSEQKQGNVTVSKIEKKLTENGNTANHNKDSKVRIKLKLSSFSTKRLTNIGGAYSVSADPPMGQRVSRVIKPHDGAKDTSESDDQMNLLGLYSQPIQISQKQKPTKKTVTLSTPIFAPKPPKTRNVVQSFGEIDADVSARRRPVGGSVDIGDYVPYRPAEEQYAATRGLVRVYLSERQSGTIKLHGLQHPGAPPATPTPAQLGHVLYIPSMNDIKAQRELKMRLEVLDRQDKKRQEKRIEENLRKEMSAQKERVKVLKTMQRLQIYALNEVMTTLENERFEKFKQQKEKHLEKDLNDIR